MKLLATRLNKKINLVIIIAIGITPLISLSAINAFVAILTLFWLIDYYKVKHQGIDRFVEIILLFGLIRTISVFFSEYPELSREIFFREIAFYFAFITLAFYLKTYGTSTIHTLYYWIINAGAAIALIGILNYNFGGIERAQSVTSGYITFSIYLLFIFSFLAFQKHHGTKTWEKVFWAVKLALVFSGIMLSLSRANIAIAIVFFIIAVFVRKINYRYILLFLLITAAISYGSYKMNQTGIEKRVSAPSQLSDRDILLKGFSDLWDEKPLTGFGPRTFQKIFPRFDEMADKKVGSWHNDYIQVYMDSGIFALAVYLFFLGYVLYKSFLFLRRYKIEDTNRDIVYGIFFSFAAAAGAGLTSAIIFAPELPIFLAMLAALLSHYIYFEKDYCNSTEAP
jgi:hypothetical protein